MASLHDVNVRLWAFLDQHYHQAPHAGLLGRSPASVWQTADRPADDLDEQRLRAALTVTERRRVRRDHQPCPSTVSTGNSTRATSPAASFTVGRCLADPSMAPWVEHEGKRLELRPVDPIQNARTKRQPRRPGVTAATGRTVAFDPPGALLDKAVGRALAQDIDDEDLF